MIRCLLISPRDPKVPKKENLKWLMGGENTYTQSLLDNPPKGVEYVHLDKAVESGEVKWGKWQRVLGWLMKLRVLPLSAGVVDIEIRGKFDVVHCYAYSLRIGGEHTPPFGYPSQEGNVPVVISDSSSNYLTLGEYFGWSEWRIKFGYMLRRGIHKLLNIYDGDLELGGYRKLLVWSNFAKDLHVKWGNNPERIEVIYPGMAGPGKELGYPPSHKASNFARATMDKAEGHGRGEGVGEKKRKSEKAKKSEITILFVGTWFKRKGGEVLVEAIVSLVNQKSKIKNQNDNSKLKKIRLVIVGQVPEEVTGYWLLVTGKLLTIEQYDYVSRERLLAEFYPRADMLVLVPRVAEGYGMVVEEAMSFGVPCVVSRVGALPEILAISKFKMQNSKLTPPNPPLVRGGGGGVEIAEAGLIVQPGSVESLRAALELLITDKRLRERLGKQARKRFLREFEIKKFQRKMKRVYEEMASG